MQPTHPCMVNASWRKKGREDTIWGGEGFVWGGGFWEWGGRIRRVGDDRGMEWESGRRWV